MKVIFDSSPLNFGHRIALPRNLNHDICTSIVNGRVSEHFVPTPQRIINKMIDELGYISPGSRVLEPSAGYGHIANSLVQKGFLTPNQIDVIEPNEMLRRELFAKGFNLKGYDILNYFPTEKYDKIIMNPPFDDGLDILHLLHCYTLLKPNGKLVAILPKSAFIPPGQPGCEKWIRDWFHTGEKREINSYLDDLLKRTHSKVIDLGNAFLKSDVPDDVETKLVVIKKKIII